MISVKPFVCYYPGSHNQMYLLHFSFWQNIRNPIFKEMGK